MRRRYDRRTAALDPPDRKAVALRGFLDLPGDLDVAVLVGKCAVLSRIRRQLMDDHAYALCAGNGQL
jgi:hypothetical protein